MATLNKTSSLFPPFPPAQMWDKSPLPECDPLIKGGLTPGCERVRAAQSPSLQPTYLRIPRLRRLAVNSVRPVRDSPGNRTDAEARQEHHR